MVIIAAGALLIKHATEVTIGFDKPLLERRSQKDPHGLWKLAIAKWDACAHDWSLTKGITLGTKSGNLKLQTTFHLLLKSPEKKQNGTCFSAVKSLPFKTREHHHVL